MSAKLNFFRSNYTQSTSFHGQANPAARLISTCLGRMPSRGLIMCLSSVPTEHQVHHPYLLSPIETPTSWTCKSPILFWLTLSHLRMESNGLPFLLTTLLELWFESFPNVGKAIVSAPREIEASKTMGHSAMNPTKLMWSKKRKAGEIPPQKLLLWWPLPP